MTGHSLVTVVIPTYNYGHFISDAVDRALGQTYPKIEIVVVDDGSNDDTAEQLKKYGNRIRCIYQENQGAPAARNRGIQEARGEYIAFLDSDDIWFPEKISDQMQLVNQAGYDAVVCAKSSVKGIGRPLAFADCFIASPGFGSSALVKRSVFDEIGRFDETGQGAEDREMMLRLTRSGRKLGVVTGKYFWIRQHNANMSSNPRPTHRNFRYVLKKVFTWPEARHRYLLKAKAWSLLHTGSAWNYLSAGRRWSALQHIVLSLLWWPFPYSKPLHIVPIRRLLMLLRILLGEKNFRFVRKMAHR